MYLQVRKSALQALESVLTVVNRRHYNHLSSNPSNPSNLQSDEDSSDDNDMNGIDAGDVHMSGDDDNGEMKNKDKASLIEIEIEDLQVFYDACLDESVSIRRQAAVYIHIYYGL